MNVIHCLMPIFSANDFKISHHRLNIGQQDDDYVVPTPSAHLPHS